MAVRRFLENYNPQAGHGTSYAIEVRRSLPYRGYEQIELSPDVAREIRGARAEAPEPMSIAEVVESARLTIAVTSPTLSKCEGLEDRRKRAKAKLYGGGAACVGGAAGGVALALAGAPLSTPVKILAGLASAAAGLGGGALAYKGYKDKKQADSQAADCERMADILSEKTPPPLIVPGDANFVTEYGNPGASAEEEALSFYRVTARPHYSVAAGLEIMTKDMRSSTFYDMHRGAGTDPSYYAHLFPEVYGLNFEIEPPGANWVHVGHIESESTDRTVANPMDLHSCSGVENRTDVMTPWGDRICRIRHHRYKGRVRDWFPFWFRGNFTNEQLKSGHHSPENRKWISWEPRFQDFNGSGAPPAGFYMRGIENAWLGDAINPEQLAGADAPGVLDGQPKRIRGPMGAVMQAYRALRAANPEVTMIYWPNTEGIFHNVVQAARRRDARAWWAKVGEWVGTLFGIASFVCEIATPIISCINPAVGAAVGIGMRAAITAGEAISEAVDRGGIGSVLDVVGRLGWSSRDLQEFMAAPVEEMRSALGTGTRNFYEDVEAMVDGLWSAKGQFAGRVGTLEEAAGLFTEAYTPTEQFKLMTSTIYAGASSQIQSAMNLDVKDVPIYIHKQTSFTNKVGAGPGRFPAPDVREFYRDPTSRRRST